MTLHTFPLAPTACVSDDSQWFGWHPTPEGGFERGNAAGAPEFSRLVLSLSNALGDGVIVQGVEVDLRPGQERVQVSLREAVLSKVGPVSHALAEREVEPGETLVTVALSNLAATDAMRLLSVVVVADAAGAAVLALRVRGTVG